MELGPCVFLIISWFVNSWWHKYKEAAHFSSSLDSCSKPLIKLCFRSNDFSLTVLRSLLFHLDLDQTSGIVISNPIFQLRPNLNIVLRGLSNLFQSFLKENSTKTKVAERSRVLASCTAMGASIFLKDTIKAIFDLSYLAITLVLKIIGKLHPKSAPYLEIFFCWALFVFSRRVVYSNIALE